jgi:hypothetical protein
MWLERLDHMPICGLPSFSARLNLLTGNSISKPFAQTLTAEDAEDAEEVQITMNSWRLGGSIIVLALPGGS